VDTALALGDERGWETVRLYDVAESSGLSLDEIALHFREKEELAEAWFDRADQALLRAAGDSAIRALPALERLHRLRMAWLEALAPHQRVTREMIKGKLEPGHVHIQLPAVFRISRTVQWWREAARRDATFLRRGLEETVLTTIFVTTFCYWLRDDSIDFADTRRLLAWMLHKVDWLL
jgi:AcrR family transcriptional regulator